MAGEIEQRDLGALQLVAEPPHGVSKCAFVEVELRGIADEREPEAAQGLGHQPRVVLRIIETRDVHIGRVADHQRNALLGRCRRSDAEEPGEHGDQKRYRDICGAVHRCLPVAMSARREEWHRRVPGSREPG